MRKAPHPTIRPGWSGNSTFSPDIRVQRIVKDLAHKMRPVTVASTPTLAEVTRVMRSHFRGAHLFAPAFFRTMQKQKWRDRSGRDVTNWQAMSKAYASKAALRK